MAKEIWKRVIGYPKYEVSNMGRVKSYCYIQSKILKGRVSDVCKRRYKQIILSHNGVKCYVYVAHLVAKHFIGLRPKGYDVSHINEDCLDNRAINLCYETRLQNNNRPLRRKRHSYSYPIGKSGYRGVTLRPCGVYVARIEHNQQKIHIGTYNIAKEAAEAFDKKAKELRGEFTTTNKSLGLV